MNAILVDDEKLNSEILREILKRYCPQVTVIAVCTDIAGAMQEIESQKPELVFLDIQMPNGSGFDLLDRIQQKNMEVIFVTAYDNFLLKAIRYSALDYILKPVNIGEIVNAVSRAEKRLTDRTFNDQLQLLLSNMQKPTQTQKIAIPVKDEYIFITVSDIVRLEANGAYTEIFTNDGKSFLTSKNMKEYEDLLPESMFCRVHHAHIINMNFVRSYHKGRGGYVQMSNGITIEVSVRKKDEFLSRFK
ncbi:LytR/AlgR family response regulator transcription factor [Taibaiella soli]|uniref:DNA-binding response regulator n=1 Tax=Taibaiella soli TaxID=1649169 RepID=A0A2W2B5P9_9BACT|nr:LytTR family DNA-binding domain-containing protein [Taibaiella soli]PZF71307.1 DNA-binding response regulator [Taibaiella soli]